MSGSYKRAVNASQPFNFRAKSHSGRKLHDLSGFIGFSRISENYQQISN